MVDVNPKKNESGFSMVELAVVLVAGAILATFSIPMLTSTIHTTQLISDARSIATTMTYARLGAGTQMTRYRLSFDLTYNRWQLAKYIAETDVWELQQGSNGLCGGAANSGIVFKTASGTAPAGFTGASATEITFNSRGTPVEGPSIVYLSNDTENYAVSVALSGKVQIWRYVNSQWISQ